MLAINSQQCLLREYTIQSSLCMNLFLINEIINTHLQACCSVFMLQPNLPRQTCSVSTQRQRDSIITTNAIPSFSTQGTWMPCVPSHLPHYAILNIQLYSIMHHTSHMKQRLWRCGCQHAEEIHLPMSIVFGTKPRSK